MRIGLGYDIHRLVKKRSLFLGGIAIPFDKGLMGHSDGDVILHAVSDALLGALGKGDIGEYFPSTDEQYKDIASSKILRKAFEFAAANKFKVGNLDITLIAERPEIASYKEKIKKNIARILKVTPGNINIKATTNEGMGLIGKGEAISAFAVVLLEATGGKRQAMSRIV